MKGEIITFLIVTVFLAGLNANAAEDKEEKRSVGKFNSLGVSISADVEISQGSETELILIGDPSTLKHIKTIVDASELKVEKVVVKISGSGDARVYAETRLEVTVSGSGDVSYYGNASVDARISGSGNVRKKD